MSARGKARHSYVTKATLKRLVDNAKAAGIDVAGIEMAPDGTVRLLPPQASAASAFDRWEDKL